MLGQLGSKVSSRWWRVVLCAGSAVYLVLAVVFLFWGRLNADEGWYLYAGKLVFDGRLPYLDFAFTQTPLLPYIYGLPQFLLGQSLYLGRLTSIVLSLITLAFAAALAWRLQGGAAAGLTALLFASFTTGVYFNTIVKTYALVALFFTLTLYTLSTHLRETVRYALALAFAACAVLVRLSAAAYFLVIVVYILAVAKERKIKIAVLSMLLVLVVAAASLSFLPHSNVLTWNLLTHHIGQWGGLPLALRLGEIFRRRLPSFFLSFELYILLGFLLLLSFLAQPQLRDRLLQQPVLAVDALGLLLFILSHFATGGWHNEYMVPAIVASFPLMATLSVQVYRQGGVDNFYRRLIPPVLVAIVLLYPAEGVAVYLDRSGNELPVEEVNDVASYVADHSGPSSSVMALEALWVPFAADRAVLPDMTMAQFSYQSLPREEASQLHLVNSDMIHRYLAAGVPQVVIFTERDWRAFRGAQAAESFRIALDRHYRLGLVKDEFGQRSERVFVYLRRADALGSPYDEHSAATQGPGDEH